MTIKDLKRFCTEEINKGNGDKIILLSNDEEGNGYHPMEYSFTETKDIGTGFIGGYIENNVAPGKTLEDYIVLG